MLLVSHLRTLFTVLFVAVVIAACGGSSGNAQSTPQTTSSFISDEPVTTEEIGSDTDNDGIYDTLQNYLEEKYAGQPEILRQGKALAAYERRFIKSIHDKQLVADMYPERLKRQLCFRKAFADPNAANEAYIYYEDRMYYERPLLNLRVIETIRSIDIPLTEGITFPIDCG